jgi:transmembrane sensor
MKIFNKILRSISPSAKAEMETLESWKDQYRKEIEALENFRIDDPSIKKLAGYKDFDPKNAWLKVENTLDLPKEKPVYKWQISYKLAGLAAMFLLCIGAFWLIRNIESHRDSSAEYIAYGDVLEVKLDDMSEILLDRQSVLSQDRYRHVSLTGRAFFSIAKDSSHEFRITTPNGTIKVLGTSFFVSATPERSFVNVVEGLVEVNNGNETIKLSAGQSAFFTKETIIDHGTDSGVMADWRDNVLVFDNVPLKDVLKIVAEHFQVDVDIQVTDKTTDCLVKTKFKNATIREVMKELNLIAKIQYEFQGEKLIISGLGC